MIFIIKQSFSVTECISANRNPTNKPTKGEYPDYSTFAGEEVKSKAFCGFVNKSSQHVQDTKVQAPFNKNCESCGGSILAQMEQRPIFPNQPGLEAPSAS